jgi:hypothetical protein
MNHLKHLKCLPFLTVIAALAGCSQLDLLVTDVKPDTWLASHPWLPVQFGDLNFILAEPSSSLIVYGLGVILAIAGVLFLRDRGKDQSRLLWGVGLLLWSASTFCAGTSYQAFAYVLKYAGRTTALWTTWWEIWYLMLFTTSMNVIAAAVAHSSTTGKARLALIAYLSANTIIYLGFVLAGAFLPNQFLASFEGMLLFTGPTFIVLLAVNLRRWVKRHALIDIRLVIAWAAMFGVTAAYFLYYMTGIADILWKGGIWFNANDMLHVGLIIWVGYLLAGVKPQVRELPSL